MQLIQRGSSVEFRHIIIIITIVMEDYYGSISSYLGIYRNCWWMWMVSFMIQSYSRVERPYEYNLVCTNPTPMWMHQ